MRLSLSMPRGVENRTAPTVRSHQAHASGFRPDIEGMRAVAVGLVVLYHAGLAPITGGYVGVDVFFVISGFVITMTLMRELDRRGTISIAGFYARRATRLLPAATAVALATLVASWLWLPPLRLPEVAADGLASALYVINYRLALAGVDYFAGEAPSPLQHYWSLAVEEQFYLVWPLLLLATVGIARVWRRRTGHLGGHGLVAAVPVLVAIIVVSFAGCVWLTDRSAPWAYFAAPTRAWELAVGALLAIGARALGRIPAPAAAAATWVGLAGVIWSAVWFDETTAFPGAAALLPVAGSALVIAGGCAAPRLGSEVILRAPVMQWIGRLSYSWYLWHWPVFIIAPHAFDGQPQLWERLVLAGGSLVLATLCYTFLENPVRTAAVLRRRPWRGISVGASLTATAAAATLAVPVLAPKPLVGSTTVPDLATTLFGPSAADGPRDDAARDESGYGRGRPLLVQDVDALQRRLGEAITHSVSMQAVPANLTPTLQEATRDSGRIYADKCDPGITAIEVSAPCEYGDTTSSTTVVLYGDSHAGHWFPTLNAIAERRHWRLVVITKSACSAAATLVYSDRLKRAYTECVEWREKAAERIRSLRPALVVMSSRDSGVPVAKGNRDLIWLDGWRTTFRALKAEGTRLVLINDTPSPVVHVPECVSARLDDVRACATPLNRSITRPRFREMVADMAMAEGVTVVDPIPWFCAREMCPAVIGNVLVYRDASHVTATYASLLAPLLERELT